MYRNVEKEWKSVVMFSKYLLHCALAAAAAQCIAIGPVCGFVAVFVGGSVTMITRNCVHRSSPNWVCR